MTRKPRIDARYECLPKEPKILFGVTTGIVVRSFFDGLLASLREENWQVSLLTTTEAQARDFAREEGVDFYAIKTVRNPSPVADLKTLASLMTALRSIRPDIAVWGTPKIGLLGVIASKICGVRCVYVPHGLRYQSASGLRRVVLMALESTSARLADTVVTVGQEVRDTMISDHIANGQSISVLGAGSANGVPQPTPIQDAREQLGLREHTFVGGFVGRVTRDKGMSELLEAWRRFNLNNRDSVLIIAGMLEPDAKTTPLSQQLETTPGVLLLGHRDDLATIYSAIDVLLLPSYREGLPTVVLEAGSYAVPCIVSDATGVSEPIVNGETGLVVRTGSVDDIVSSLEFLSKDYKKRTQMGAAAVEHIRANYDRELVQSNWRKFLRAELESFN